MAGGPPVGHLGWKAEAPEKKGTAEKRTDEETAGSWNELGIIKAV
jgi:hypothetical protein